MHVALLFFCACNFNTDKKDRSITIDVWYGDVQNFGQQGIPQKWINILGNIGSKNGIASLSYTLNDLPADTLSIGSDLHRLAATGDFNIDIATALLRDEENTLTIIAKDTMNNTLKKKVKINFTGSKKWPIPYSINWKDVHNIQDVVQVMDGQWEITKDGLHNIDTYYDRAVAIGDSTWTDYEVSTTVTFHSFTVPAKGPPTYEVSHAAIASRWPGHDVDEDQPHRKWYPLGATSEFRLTAGLDSCRWRIFDGPKPNLPDFYVEQPISDYRSIKLNKKYGIKHRVETSDKGVTKYSVKLWPFDEGEPDGWDFTGIEQDENVTKGSALLIAHHTNVTFGNVYVSTIESSQPEK